MTAEEKIGLALVFIDCIRKGSDSAKARLPGNEALRVHALGYCDIIEAALNGDTQRAMALVQDMSLRMRLAVSIEEKP